MGVRGGGQLIPGGESVADDQLLGGSCHLVGEHPVGFEHGGKAFEYPERGLSEALVKARVEAKLMGELVANGGRGGMNRA